MGNQPDPGGGMRLRMFAAALAIGLIAGRAKAADGAYKLIKDVEIGGEDRDCPTVDAAAKRLSISPGAKVIVFDMAKDAIAGEIPHTPGASRGNSGQ
jgi:hypothetical protein